ncbi:ABC transporter ATP-binding protein [Halalkalibacterium halodurans]|uniref:ABC transporter ATP-binding protein n=1 Tax=Halalkalibacterium halodurans TaxID=86665 RepID=UPI002E233B4B|nr:ABC transporter ATP-binding protein [Halalkalibacterium halodurans]MED4079279.1 ABC transporter ATP-binding protein [Halalkalibacterium halodurans]MED4085350.1 ABC transporter ATP-binding protein [Halalkalibacterium halodurans]MED4105386.1 ABC transporter ATP-binding protein [Halalkalibacterium halodurans]MED4108203.1 ABC transporter ATP-binding protein [Halalkalibacterium halodurans]
MSHVELLNLCKSYDQTTFAVEDINVSIKEGEFFILVGPSGCGKSTMLRMIAGLEDISAGELKIHGATANHLPPSKRNLSMVFQNYALYPHLTVEENILFGLKVRKVKKAERSERCQRAAAMLGLTDYLKRKPRELSGGQRQRVALARAVVSEAPLCLMDEPLSNLDAKLRGHMRTEIRQLQRQLGMTMIYVTHDQVEAMTMGDRIMVLKDGQVQQVGSPLDIYNAPANLFVATFIGAPPMNIAKATVDRMNRELVIGSLRLPIEEQLLMRISSDTVQLGIRPEQIARADAPTPEHVQWHVTVTNVEVLGNETLLAFKVGEHEWKAKWLGQWPYQLHETIAISFAKEHLYLFDGETGKTLVSPDQNQPYLRGAVSLESS